MKRYAMIAGFLGLPLVSFAAATGDVCTGGAAATKVTVTAATDSSEFLRRDLPVQCSANVVLGYSQNALALAVASASAKGKTYYTGSSEGGSVTRESDCASSGCGTSSLTGKATTKLNSSSSSS